MSTWQERLEKLGQQLREHRLEAELTQHVLGRRAGIGGKYVSEIERGTRDLPFSTLHALVCEGLERELVIAFAPNGDSRKASGTAIPLTHAQLAREIAALPTDERAMVTAIVRHALRLARRSR